MLKDICSGRILEGSVGSGRRLWSFEFSRLFSGGAGRGYRAASNLLGEFIIPSLMIDVT